MSNQPNSNFVPLASLQKPQEGGSVWWQTVEKRGEWETQDLEQFDESGVEIPEASRRRFISLMAGSLALAGLSGCTRQPTELILPYVNAPENVIPGKPKYYATAVPDGGYAQGVIVESHLGRPTKVEGNPTHPASLGATSVHSQACLMDLYDPDRAKEITRLGIPTSWDAFLIGLEEALRPLRARHGAGLSILTETIVSPTIASQMDAVMQAFPAAKWHQFEPTGAHSARAASKMALGRPLHTYYNLADADVVVSLDSDFLACGTAWTRYARDFAARRRRGNRLDMNRLYVVESTMTSTGGKADHRLSLRHDAIAGFAQQLAATLGATGITAPAAAIEAHWVQALANDLKSHRGRCVVLPGDGQPPTVHALAHAMNFALGNHGKTVIHTDPIEAKPIDQIASLRELCTDMFSGQVQLLLMLGGNPVYNAPADLKLSEALSKVAASVHLSSGFNETSLKTTWQVPESHFLETWGDARAFDGTASVCQPLIEPLYDSRSTIELLDVLLALPGRRGYEIVREHWMREKPSPDFEGWWRKTLHDGLVSDSAAAHVDPPFDASWAINLKPSQLDEAALEVVFAPDVYIGDGRYANNMWLQELPRPMTKLTWDNAVMMSIDTAKRLGFDNQQHVELTTKTGAVRGSVWILPGQPDNSIRLDLGFGRTQSGRAGNGAGFDAYPLRTSDQLWSTSGAKIRKLDTKYPLATTQMQQSMAGRDVVISNTLEGYKRDPKFAKEENHAPEHNLTLYPHWDYRGYKWGMSIDLTACVNCNACVVACQAENNIPVVGKEQVLARRAMHWLRIDTYYKGDPRIPEAVYQPIPCMQCENAPCELVCPVQATNHSSEGLNNMVYNRCVGTRYCSNNCPYKVRRFNFLLFQDWTTETLKMQRNPDVSVRSRGVMEKCTYCVQRIKEAEITSQEEERGIRDGEIQTACQQACPTEAIIFGDLNNRGARVSKLKAEVLDYSLLAELNTRPRTTYLAELKNPNSALKETAAG